MTFSNLLTVTQISKYLNANLPKIQHFWELHNSPRNPPKINKTIFPCRGIKFFKILLAKMQSLINPFLVNVLILYPLQMPEKQSVFREYKMGTLTRNGLTYFSPMSHFYTYGFLTFSRGMEMWHWTKMG